MDREVLFTFCAERGAYARTSGMILQLGPYTKSATLGYTYIKVVLFPTAAH